MITADATTEEQLELPLPTIFGYEGNFLDLEEHLKPLFFSRATQAQVANWIWRCSGRPDGEQPSNYPGLKVKEIHWYRASEFMRRAWSNYILMSWHSAVSDCC